MVQDILKIDVNSILPSVDLPRSTTEVWERRFSHQIKIHCEKELGCVLDQEQLLKPGLEEARRIIKGRRKHQARSLRRSNNCLSRLPLRDNHRQLDSPTPIGVVLEEAEMDDAGGGQEAVPVGSGYG